MSIEKEKGFFDEMPMRKASYNTRGSFKLNDAEFIDEVVGHCKYLSNVMFGIVLERLKVIKMSSSSICKVGVYISVNGEDDDVERWYKNISSVFDFIMKDISVLL